MSAVAAIRRIVFGLALVGQSVSQCAPGVSQPVRARDFLDSIGVNTHLPYVDGRFGDVRNVVEDLRYLHVMSVRDYGLAKGGRGQASYGVLADAGVKFDTVIFGWPIGPAVADAHDFVVAHPGAIASIEGPNEVNNFPVKYNGMTGVQGATAYQSALYAAFKADPLLAHVPIYNLTSYPDIQATADVANFHAYAKGGAQPYWELAKSLATQRAAMPGKPIVLTETGYYTLPTGAGWGGVDEPTQAKLILNTIFDAQALGAKRVFLYELLDEYPDPGLTDQEKHFGLFDIDNRPKASAQALRNLITILDDPSPTARSFNPAAVAFGVSGLPLTARTLVLESSSGRYALLIWNEPKIWDRDQRKAVEAPSATLTLSFQRTVKNAAVYDPLVGSSPMANPLAGARFSLNLSEDPVIFTFRPA